MQNVERLSVTLPKEMAKTVRSAVSSGGYASNSEVIREAVRLWQESNAARLERISTFRDAIAAADADPRPNLTDEQVDDHFSAKLVAARKP